MSRVSLEQFELPTVEEYDIICDAISEVVGGQFMEVKYSQAQTNRYFEVERPFVDTQLWVWPPLVVCMKGVHKVRANQQQTVIEYTEKPQNRRLQGAWVTHLYVLEKQAGQMLDFTHDIQLWPEVGEPRQDITLTDDELDESEEGRDILEANFSGPQDMTKGDCGVLFDRIAMLL